MSSPKPLRRDRSKELDRLANRIGEMVKAGLDPIMVDDLYTRMAKDWDRAPQDKADRLELLQNRAIDDIVERVDEPDRVIQAYDVLWKRIRNHNDPWPDPPVELRKSRGSGNFVASFAAGYYISKMAKMFIADVFRFLNPNRGYRR